MGILITYHGKEGWKIGIRESFYVKDDEKAREIADYFIERGVLCMVSKEGDYNKISVENKTLDIGDNKQNLLTELDIILIYKNEYAHNPNFSKEDGRN